jgi:hypothetical protein
MAMRNWWIEGQVDGRRSEMTGGPKSRDGGFELTVYMRDEGSSKIAVTVSGRATRAGELVLNVTPGTRMEATSCGQGFEIETKR